MMKILIIYRNPDGDVTVNCDVGNDGMKNTKKNNSNNNNGNNEDNGDITGNFKHVNSSSKNCTVITVWISNDIFDFSNGSSNDENNNNNNIESINNSINCSDNDYNDSSSSN